MRQHTNARCKEDRALAYALIGLARRPIAIDEEIPQGFNQPLDFALTDSCSFRILAVIGDFSRECPALVADTSLSGIRVARKLDRIAELRGYPGR